jgi:hypothetical protein
MTRRLIAMGVSSLMLIGSQAFAGDAARQPTILKRQSIKDCMTKQMAADKTLSYNDATKTCTDRVRTQSAKLASTEPPKQ